MRYSYEFKLRYVELYKEGSWMETPENVKTKFFRDKIRQWCRIADSCGSQVLKHSDQSKEWAPDFSFRSRLAVST
ncbi:hypothetical protein [Eubacterium callanderi]|uniref:hypothetical protein n=1 Tax=Eubacterium callanderi TaxID=53442 RepID=UPI001160276C|nr:hypothetical protein [Eubacterium callanderi]